MGTLRVAAILSGLVLAGNQGRAGGRPATRQRADYRIACQWWTELPEVDAGRLEEPLFRYNVLFNGAVVAEPQHEPADRALGRPRRAALAVAGQSGR